MAMYNVYTCTQYSYSYDFRALRLYHMHASLGCRVFLCRKQQTVYNSKANLANTVIKTDFFLSLPLSLFLFVSQR